MSGTSPTPLQRFKEELKLARTEVAGFALTGKVDPNGYAAQKFKTLCDAAKNELAELDKSIDAKTPGTDQDKAAVRGIRMAWRIVGRYLELVATFNREPFDILPQYDPTPRPNTPPLIVDIKIIVRKAYIPDDVYDLKTALDKALNVARSVMADRMAWWRPWGSGEGHKKAVQESLDGYMLELCGIARTGLMTNDSSHVKLAQGELDRFRLFFTMREAGIVKGSYIRWLFLWSSLAAALFILLYCFIKASPIPDPPATHPWHTLFWNTRNFHLMAAGTAIGTWISFSLRRPELSFEDLAVLEPDRLQPWARLIYMIGLSSLVGLLLFSGAVVAGVGDVTGFDGLHKTGSSALLLGLLAGIAERGLGRAVERRGEEFASAIGGAKSSTKAQA